MIEKKEFSITGSNQKVITGDITFDSRNLTSPLVIFVHGFKGFKDWGTHNVVARHFALNGFKYLKFNFSHNGTTPRQLDDTDDFEAFAENTFSKELYDLDEVIRFACSGQDFAAATHATLIGHSRGGGISILQASTDPRISNLITWASVNRFDTIWEKEQEENWEKDGVIYIENERTKKRMPLNAGLFTDLKQNSRQLDIEAAAKRLNIPWLIVQGDADPKVSVETAKQLHDTQLVSKLAIIEGANHVFGGTHPYNQDILPPQLQQACDKSMEFLQRNAVKYEAMS